MYEVNKRNPFYRPVHPNHFSPAALDVLENRVLMRISGEVTGEWRKLHNEELRDLYS
jgi:hypothetical protein